MMTSPARISAAILLAALATGCSRSGTAPVQTAARPAADAPAATPAAPTAAHQHDAPSAGAHEGMHGPTAAITVPQGALYTEADVRFMQGMIAHHGQAIHMSKLAASRGADPRLLKFALKIDQSQAAEIVLMQDWLRAHKQAAPDAESWRTMTMHGMLTAEEMEKLAAARGTEFDRLFLTYMIRHHEGALRMVAELLASPRAAQDVDVSVFANDVETVQTAEIAVMYSMLADL